MGTYGETFAAFGGQTITDFVRERNRSIVEHLKRLSDTELFDTDEGKLVAGVADQFRVQVPVIDFDKKTRELTSPADVPEYAYSHRTQPKRLVKYTLPVKGSARLLEIAPSSIQMIGFNVLPKLVAHRAGDNESVTFHVHDYGDVDAVVRDASAILDNLRVNSETLARHLESYNGGVASTVLSAVAQEKQRRKQERHDTDDLLNRLP